MGAALGGLGAVVACAGASAGAEGSCGSSCGFAAGLLLLLLLALLLPAHACQQSVHRGFCKSYGTVHALYDAPHATCCQMHYI